MPITVTKIIEFDYAHSLPDYPGKCRRVHGHRGVAEIEIGLASGSDIDNLSRTGMVEDFSTLKDVINNMVLDYLDHRNLNETLPINYQPPTAENMATFIWDKIEQCYDDRLVRVRVYETPTSYAEVKK